jgi:hypothetical protein
LRATSPALGRSAATLVATASHEPWYLVGGPDLYHDSYTTSILVEPERVDALLLELEASVLRVGGRVEEA